MPHISCQEKADDGVSDIARGYRTDSYRCVGGMLVSAEIVQFIPRPGHHNEQTDFPTIAFRSAVPPDGLTTDHAGMTPANIAGRTSPARGRRPDLLNTGDRTFATE